MYFNLKTMDEHTYNNWVKVKETFESSGNTNNFFYRRACAIIGGAPALIVMEDFTNIGSGSRIICATDDFMQGLISPVVPIEHRTVFNKPVIFKRYATLGVNCTVLPGITLGEGSIVGAGSVVTKDTEPWTVYAGSPAKPIKKRDSKRILESAQKLMNYE